MTETQALLSTLKSGLMVAQRDGHQILQLPDPHLVAVLEALEERITALEQAVLNRPSEE